MPGLLGDDLEFPPPETADADGLLAVGGDLSPERLLAAYRRGVFPWPWFFEDPMLWWCPDPRFVLYPRDLRVGKSLRQRVRSERFDVRLDTGFRAIVEGCASAERPEGPGTWLLPGMIDAYVRLHELGYAHCAGSWRDGELKGGLYGVALGGAFFGESMFHREPDASKVAFVTFVEQLDAWGFDFVDCQMETDHLARFGARPVPRTRFLAELADALARPDRPGPWRLGGA